MNRNQKIFGAGILTILVVLLGPTLGIPYLIRKVYHYLDDQLTGEDETFGTQPGDAVELAGNQYQVDCFGNMHALQD